MYVVVISYPIKLFDVFMHITLYVHGYMHAHTHVTLYMYVCTHMHARICMHTHTHIYIKYIYLPAWFIHQGFTLLPHHLHVV